MGIGLGKVNGIGSNDGGMKLLVERELLTMENGEIKGRSKVHLVGTTSNGGPE